MQYLFKKYINYNKLNTRMLPTTTTFVAVVTFTDNQTPPRYTFSPLLICTLMEVQWFKQTKMKRKNNETSSTMATASLPWKSLLKLSEDSRWTNFLSIEHIFGS